MLVEADKADGVLTVTLRRAEKRNALSTAVADALVEILDNHQDDRDLKIVVLRGDGDQAFASGGDLKELSSIRTIEAAKQMADGFRVALDAVRSFPLPVIGALNGDALGGGAELAMACDIRIAAEHARLGFLQGRLSISTAWGGGVDLLAAVGISRGLRLLGRAEILSAQQALDWNLVDAVAAPGQDFNAFIADYIAGYLERPPQVMRAFKAVAGAARFRSSRAETLALENIHFAGTWAHDDHWQAVATTLGRAGRVQNK